MQEIRFPGVYERCHHGPMEETRFPKETTTKTEETEKRTKTPIENQFITNTFPLLRV